jgi:hypothetical protein
MTVTRRRLARKRHYCDCGIAIAVGHVYLEHTAFPGLGDDAGYATAAGHPVRLAECAPCAKRYGRDDLLGDVPIVQLYSLGLA